MTAPRAARSGLRCGAVSETHSASANALGESADRAARAFAGRATRIAIRPLGRGHIHDTYRVSLDGCEPSELLLQRLNAYVFRDLDAVMENVARIGEFLFARAQRLALPGPERRALPPLRTADGEWLHRAPDGSAWRALPFVAHSRSVAYPESAAQAHAAARAFAEFAAALAELPAPPLRVTIPNFHDLPGRCDALRTAARRDDAGRLSGARRELDAALAQAESLNDVARAALPRLPVHNDCKLDNLLFDARTGEALCVVDLDTCMEGTRLFDFGELVRTAACPAAEDAADGTALRADPALLEALASGYREGSGAPFRADELAALACAGAVMALENAVRFLTDHLDGDRYFKVERPDHNLRRCRAQLLRCKLLYAERASLARWLAR
jgi:Ser/Thr protein kinase RdoA (MazF antagonist)